MANNENRESRIAYQGTLYCENDHKHDAQAETKNLLDACDLPADWYLVFGNSSWQAPEFETPYFADYSHASSMPCVEGTSNFEETVSGTPERQLHYRTLPYTTVIQNDLGGYELNVPAEGSTTEISQQLPLIDQSQSNIAASNTLMQQSNLFTPLPTTQAVGDQMSSALGLSQNSTHIVQPTIPLRDSEGRFICNRNGCDNWTFTRKSAWQIHMDKHNRPYKCEAAECTLLNGFSSKGDLERHRRAKHTHLLPDEVTTHPSNHVFFCSEPTCSRSSSSAIKNPFSRKDGRNEHVKRMHKELLPNSLLNIPQGSDLTASAQLISSFSSVSDNSAGQVDAPVSSIRKRRRFKKSMVSTEGAVDTNEGHNGASEEVELLKRKMRDLENELESSRRREATLFEVISKFTNQSDH